MEQSFESNKGPRLLALDNINLKINAGEFVCIVGPSGCGKTSLLSLIAGLSFPTRGEVQLNNKPVTGPGTDRILIFQEHGLFPWLTVGQNVEFGMKMNGVRRPSAKKKLSAISNSYTSPTSRTATHTSSPAACGSVLPLRALWQRSRTFY